MTRGFKQEQYGCQSYADSARALLEEVNTLRWGTAIFLHTVRREIGGA
jgi:hypothetical protein